MTVVASSLLNSLSPRKVIIWIPDTGYALLSMEVMALVAAIVIPSNSTALNKKPAAHGATLFTPITSMNSMPDLGTRPDTERRLNRGYLCIFFAFDAAAANSAECGVRRRQGNTERRLSRRIAWTGLDRIPELTASVCVCRRTW
jgi:hypothetical protein